MIKGISSPASARDPGDSQRNSINVVPAWGNALASTRHLKRRPLGLTCSALGAALLFVFQFVDELLKTFKRLSIDHAGTERSVMQDHLVDLFASPTHSHFPRPVLSEPSHAVRVPERD